MKELYEKANYLSLNFTDIISSNLISPLLKIFIGILSCSLIYNIIYNFIIKGTVEYEYVIYKFLNVLLIIYIIKNPAIFNDYIVGSIHEFLYILIKGLGLIQSHTMDFSSKNILPIITVIQAPIENIITLAGIIMSSLNPLKIISASIIILIYSYLSALLLGTILEFTFTSFIITSLSPLFSFFLAYKVTSSYTYKSIKYLFIKVINIVLAVVNLKFILFLILEIIPELESEDTLEIYKLAKWYKDYLILISIGLFGIKLHTQTQNFSQYIFSHLTPAIAKITTVKK